MMKTKNFNVRLISFSGVFFDDKIGCVTVPSNQGVVTLQKHHMPFIAALKSGVIQLKNFPGDTSFKSYAINFGFLKKDDKECVIFCDLKEVL